GGKGVNVSSLLGQYGVPSIATGFLGRANQSIFKEHFKATGVADEFIRVSGETRTGIKIIDESSRETTDINFPGLEPSFSEMRRFESKLRKLVRKDRWFVIAGSLPAGISVGFFEEVMALLKQ